VATVFITTVTVGMIIIMIRMMIMVMIIRHRWHREEVQIQQRPSAGVSFVTSRIDRSKIRPRQSDLFVVVNYLVRFRGLPCCPPALY